MISVAEPSDPTRKTSDKSSGRKLWLLWLVSSLLLCAYFAYLLLAEDNAVFDNAVLMPGALSDGHHQLTESCDSCHSDSFGGGEVLQTACVDCHGFERKKPFDSHPAAKFKDPRNASLLADIDALQCITCHTEHKPEITAKNAVTQPVDFCFHCHEDIGEDRISHQGMEFATCASSGCHNFHDNRALYTDFLLKHSEAPALMAVMQVPDKEFADLLDEVIDYPTDKYPIEALSADQADAPEKVAGDILTEWAGSAHARSGANCSSCHIESVSDNAENTENAEQVADAGQWVDNPDHNSCKTCHSPETEQFLLGKHGMRLNADLSPMTPAMALLEMRDDAAHKELSCSSCHDPHSVDVVTAAVDSCVGCHNDKHTLAYEDSPHGELWKNEVAGVAEHGTGVSCATCHMPRIDADVSEWTSRIMVDHNQNANLSPNSKMLRGVCMECHGLGFSIDALADQALIDSNFNGQPSLHVESIDLAVEDNNRFLAERAAAKKAAEEAAAAESETN